MKIKMIDFGGKAPTRKHYNDAGADVYSPKNYSLWPGMVLKVPLGFGLELPDGCVGFIFTRSSLAAQGVDVLLPPIDPGYRGEIHAMLTNVGDSEVLIKEGDRIGQLVILPCIIPDLVSDLGEERGKGAFGSTGR